MKLSKQILVISPHADDEILGCGGTIAKHLSENDIVTIVICTNGNIGAPEIFSKKYINDLRKEALLSHKKLGSIKTIFLDFPAPKLDTYPSYKIADKLSLIIKKIKPNIIYLPFPGDLHNDHRCIHNAGLVASRTNKNNFIEKILLYEVLSETECSSIVSHLPFKPNFFVDISKFLSKKLKAMKEYQSQLKKYPNSRSLETIESLSKFRGSSVNLKNAEAFMIERIIKK
tara:strand:+ start:535 stop:1221 length:687 start_codon:yes stop_codon:yes gene_type:complete